MLRIVFIGCLFWHLCADAAGMPAKSMARSDAAIEILMLNILDEPNDVQIVFRIREDIVEGEVLFYRIEFDGGGSYSAVEIDVLDFEGLEPFDLPDYQGVYVYEDQGIPSSVVPPYYYYLSFDFPEQGTPDAQTRIHRTIHLESPGFDLCTREVNLEWSSYQIITFPEFPDGETEALPFSVYQVFVNGSFAASVGMEETSLDLVLEAPGLQTFSVRAAEVDHPSEPGLYAESNTRQATFSWPELDEPVLTKADVTGEASVELHGHVAGDYQQYVFYFERNRPGEDFIAAGQIDRPSFGELVFVDEGVDGLHEGIWYYRVRAHLVDDDQECPEPAVTSGRISTIWLGGEIRTQSSDQLLLEFGFDQDPPADTFILQQRLPGETDFADVAEDISSPYQLDLSGELPLAGELTYRLVGETGTKTEHSNVVRLAVNPEINIPNAFRPGSSLVENQVFSPQFIGFTPDVYIRVYNRYGLKVFESGPAPGAAWDGSLNGKDAPEGAYFYHIVYTSNNPHVEDGEISGTVYLLR